MMRERVVLRVRKRLGEMDGHRNRGGWWLTNGPD